MIYYIENYPVIVGALVALFSCLAIAFQLFGFQQRALAIGTTTMGCLGIVATFGAAQRAGVLSLIGFIFVILAYLFVSAYLWTRKTDNN
jgi:hypothetical protein